MIETCVDHQRADISCAQCGQIPLITVVMPDHGVGDAVWCLRAPECRPLCFFSSSCDVSTEIMLLHTSLRL